MRSGTDSPRASRSGSGWTVRSPALPSRRYAGPPLASRSAITAPVSSGSPGAATASPGMDRMMARSSVAWWDMPSAPYASPPPTATAVTFASW